MAGSLRLLALDIDGTLLTSERLISARTRRALQAARAGGVRLALVTGRRLPSARRVARDLGGRVAVIAHNGALIEEDGRLLLSRPLPRAAARRALEVGMGCGAEPVLHCGDRGEGWIFVRAAEARSPHVTYYLERAAADVREVPDLVEALETEEPMQVMFGGPRRRMAPTRAALDAALDGQARVERSVYPATDLEILEVLEETVTKQGALAWLRARWDVAAAETLAIGDNWSDREMISTAGVGYVMGNADPDLRRLGLPVLPSNDEDGVALAVERHVLGNEKGGE